MNRKRMRMHSDAYEGSHERSVSTVYKEILQVNNKS